MWRRDLPHLRPYAPYPSLSRGGDPLPYRVPALCHSAGAGISGLLAIAYAEISLGLGPDFPWGDCRSPGTLGYSVCGVVTRMTLLIPAFALRFTPAALTVDLLCYPRTLPYP